MTSSKINSYKFIVTSDEPWGNVWHTQLHYAYELSKQYKTLYINPPRKGFFINLRYVIKELTLNPSSNLKIITYFKLFPSFFGKWGLIINDFLTSIVIYYHLDFKIKNVILWRIDHFRLHHIFFIKPKFQIYHVIDYWTKFIEDKMLARKSDMVVFTSPRFKLHYAKIAHSSINIPQGISDDELVCDISKIKDIKLKYNKFIFACGTFSEAISINILEEVASRFKDINLVLAGPEIFTLTDNKKRFEKLKSLENVYFMNVVPGKELRNYVAASSVCLIHYPFDLNNSKEVRSPLKVINYLAQLKPVVTSYDCEIDGLNDKAIYYASNIENYILHITNLLSGRVTVNEPLVIEYLQRIRYPKLINEILNELIVLSDEKK